MLRPRFSWKLYVSYALLVFVTSGVIGVLVQRQVRSSLLDEIEQRLVHGTAFLAPQAARVLGGPASAAEDPQTVVTRLGRETGTRVTLVLPDGEVLADSHQDPSLMENHADRPEILEAYSEPHGMARRPSTTLDRDLLYVARVIRDEAGAPLGVVRTAIPLTEVGARVGAARHSVVLGAALGSLVALAIGLIVGRRITSPVAEMTEVAEALQEGEYGRRVRTLPADEFGVLGRTLNRLADELTDRIDTLARQSGQLGAMVASMEEGVLAVDREDRVILSNRAAHRVLGIEDLDIRGERLWEVARVPGLVELLADVRESETSAHEEVVLHREATEITVDARATPFRVNGGRGVVIVLYDISNLRRLERMRTDFVANVSHELKTPLTSIAGYVDTLVDGAIDDQEHNVRFLKKARAQVRRLESLVNDLLALSAIESPEETLSVRNVDWVPIVQDALRRYQDAFDAASLVREARMSDDPLVVVGDAESMIQIVDNLVDNAIRYTPEGGRVVIRLGREEPWAVLEVEDTGIGISTGDQERIFERFYRADRARSGEPRGTGLGLAIVKHLVLRLAGEVEVESAVGRGSRFRVRLPLAARRPGEARPRQ